MYSWSVADLSACIPATSWQPSEWPGASVAKPILDNHFNIEIMDYYGHNHQLYDYYYKSPDQLETQYQHQHQTSNTMLNP